MLATAPSPSFLAAALEDSGWFGSLAATIGVAALGLLSWQLWRTQRLYALELAEQSRLMAEEQEKSSQAWAAMQAVAGESQAKSEMLATLSREIRAHLNGIIGSADLMLDNALEPAQRQLLTTLRTSADSLHQSLNDVLDYSSIETGRIQITQTPFDLRQPLIEVVESLSPLALLKGLELVLIIAPDVPLAVIGDTIRLRQILHNLMSHAVKSTASGRVVLRAELPQGSSGVSKQGATWLHFSVSDTGAGITEEMQATLFERTVESDLASTRRSGGSGLELAISKRLVELMGGQIGARTLPEGGSEFWVILALPATKAAASATAAPVDGLHVVVLDDLTASRVAVSAVLARMGVDQDATDTMAKAAVLLHDALETGARDLVLLLDDSAVQKSADGLARLLAPDSPLRSTRVVLMGRNPEALAATRLDFPLASIVRKPILRPEVLLAALKATSASSAGPASASAPVADAGAGAKPAFPQGPHVLVVDDDTISRSVSSQRLERLGCVVETAESGAEAVELARRNRFELIFMDCQMPEMDGFATTEKIRAAAGSKAPPIVALTANISERDRERCFAAGMCDFISKPVTKAELARVLKRWTQPEGASAD
jgi:signal transduction histidine kinase/DNA-binding NarL/FixJ family response regulator